MRQSSSSHPTPATAPAPTATSTATPTETEIETHLWLFSFVLYLRKGGQETLQVHNIINVSLAAHHCAHTRLPPLSSCIFSSICSYLPHSSSPSLSFFLFMFVDSLRLLRLSSCQHLYLVSAFVVDSSSVCPSVCSSLYSAVCPSFCLSFFWLSVGLFVYMSVCFLPVCPSARWSVLLSVRLSVLSFACLSVCLSVCSAVCTSCI